MLFVFFIWCSIQGCLSSSGQEALVRNSPSSRFLSDHGTWWNASTVSTSGAVSTQNDPVFFLHMPDTKSGPQLKDYLNSYVSKYVRLHGLDVGNDTTDLKILIFGDSVDGIMTHDTCDVKLPFVRSDSPAPFPCDSPNFVLRSHIIPGSHRSGPYHCTGNTNCTWNSPYFYIEKGFREFEKKFGPPGMVILSTILWDIARLHDHTNLTHAGLLSEETLNGWIVDVQDLMRRIEALVNGSALLVYHNAACPRLREDGETFVFSLLERWSILAQLNAASRTAVKERPMWNLVDFEEMALPFCNNKQYPVMRDRHHPVRWFMFNVLNRYINALVSLPA
eukprot:jgi/Botrbrau1/10134/Bobra.0191s0007.1